MQSILIDLILKLFRGLIISDFKTNQRLKPEKLKTFAKNLSYYPKNRTFCVKNFEWKIRFFNTKSANGFLDYYRIK